MESFGIRCEISRCHSWQRSHTIFPRSSACQWEWISMSDCILPMHFPSEAWIRDRTSTFPALSCLQVPLCIKVPYVFGQARRAVNFITMPCFTERQGYRWWNPAHLNQRQNRTSREGVKDCLSEVPAGWGWPFSVPQVKLFQRDLSYLSPPIVFKRQWY